MKKLKDIKNGHLLIGILILVFQLIFQISNTVYFFGLILILLSAYEFQMIKKLTFQKDNIQKIREILNQYKYLNFLIIIPVLFLVNNLISEIKNEGDFLDLVLNNPILYFNVFIIGGILLHFSISNEIKNIEREVIS